MRVLVTGAGGHVGAAVAERLVAGRHDVVALSRRRSPVAAAQVVRADIAERREVERLADEPPCEAIVHAAAAIGSDPSDSEITRANCLGTQHVLWLAERWSCRQFVFTSSIQVVGRPRAVPIDEEHALDPPTAYHATKLFGERLVALAGRRGMAASTLRLTAPIGPGMADGRILSVFVRRALAGAPLDVAGSGTRRQDYVDVRDVADAVALALDGAPVGVLNVGSGRAVSNRELAERCVRALGSASEVRLGATTDTEEGVSWEVSIARASGALGYAPRRSLEDSIVDLATAMTRSPRLEEFNR